VLDRLEGALHAYLDAVAVEFRASPVSRGELGSVRERFQAQSRKVFAVTEELGKLNEENFESRRRALNQSVQNLQNEIWETMLTALVLGAMIAGASVFRISSLEKESAASQKATRTGRGAATASLATVGLLAGAGTQVALARAA